MSVSVNDVNETPFQKVSGNGATRAVVDGALVNTHKPVFRAGVAALSPNPYTGLPVKQTPSGKVVSIIPTNNTK